MAARQRHARSVATIHIGLGLLVGLTAWSALASEHSLRQVACAAYDVHVLTVIEDHGLIGDTDHRRLAEAAMIMLDARMACGRGETESALALYESISLDRVRMSPFHRVLLR
jgi:hypothetical protein